MIDLFDGNTIEVINFAKHQSLERIEEKRALNRARVKEFREKQKSNALLMHTTCDVTLTDKNKKENKNKNKKERENRGIFQIPTLQEISDYCMERQNGINAETFFNHYESKGWMIGKNKMKDWKAAVRTWEQRDNQTKQEEKPWYEKTSTLS